MTVYMKMKRDNDIQVVPLHAIGAMRGYRAIGIVKSEEDLPAHIAVEVDHYMARAEIAEAELETLRSIANTSVALRANASDRSALFNWQRAVDDYLRDIGAGPS